MPWSPEVVRRAPPRPAPASAEVRASAAYTIRDTPEVVRRIEADLDLVLREVRSADPHLRALILTGGFARGEGAVLRGVPQNDYDLVALRGPGRPNRPYATLRKELEATLGLHLDLQPVWTARLPLARPSIFWYETALRGRVLWGDARLLNRLRTRDADRIDPAEGLRLLVNRAAGLLLAEPTPDPHLHRIQASKGLLAVLDAHLLAAEAFAPSQRERWVRFQTRTARGKLVPPKLAARLEWISWAFRFKVDPEHAPPQDARAAWREAAAAILDTVPVALAHARFANIPAYMRDDRALDHAVYALHAASVPGARRWVPYPTGRVRAATLALLEERLGRTEGVARRHLAAFVRDPPTGLAAVPLLEKLRNATLQ